MVPQNGYFRWLSHSAIGASITVPAGTTHIVVATSTPADVTAVLNSYLGGGTNNPVNMLIPTGTFVRIGNFTPGTSVITNTALNTISTTVASITFYQWNKEG